MDKSTNTKEWLKRALSNLNLGKNLIDGVSLEDLCFNFQQAVEKSIKAVLLKNEIKIPRTNSISELLSILKEQSVVFPEELGKRASILSIYAVSTRYPDNYFEVDKNDYDEALAIAVEVYNWAVSTIK